MRRKRSIAGRPVSEAVSRIVDQHLRAARRALERDDAGGLHAFRVGLRRARATLRAFRQWLPHVRRKDRRRLRDLARETNAGRDAEVLLPLLARLARELPAADRTAVARLRRRLRRSRLGAWPERLDELRAALREATRPLRRRLRREPATAIPFGQALGALLAEDARRLASELAALGASEAPAAFHAARLTVKRARYLLEPVRRTLDGAAALVEGLSELQTQLGDLHDLDVLAVLVRTEIEAGRGTPGGLQALDGAIAAGRAALVARLRHEWIDERGPALAVDLAAAARSLAGAGDDLHLGDPDRPPTAPTRASPAPPDASSTARRRRRSPAHSRSSPRRSRGT
jgi:CHAD domain-containing protein